MFQTRKPQEPLSNMFGGESLDETLHASLKAWGLVSELRVIIDMSSTSAEKHGHCLPDQLQEYEDQNLELDTELREAGKKKRIKRIPYPQQLLRTLPMYARDPRKVLTAWFDSKSLKSRKEAVAESSLSAGDQGSPVGRLFCAVFFFPFSLG